MGQQNSTWLATVYEQYHRKVYRFALKHTRDSAQAEDLTHDVFLKVWQHHLSETIPVDAQLLHIARQLIINQYKRDLVRQKAFAGYTLENLGMTPIDESSQLTLTTELQQQYEQVMTELPPRRREIFELSRVEHLTYDEIADRLSISRATVESQMVKALKFLRQRLTTLLLSALFLLFW